MRRALMIAAVTTLATQALWTAGPAGVAVAQTTQPVAESGVVPTTRPARRASTRPATTRRARTTAPAAVFLPAADAKAACDAFLDAARKGDVEGAVARMLPRPNTPDPAADVRKKVEALVAILKNGGQIRSFDGYCIGNLALVPVAGQRPMRAGRADADPMMVMKVDGQWKVLATSARAYALDEDGQAAALALNAKWREVRPTLLPAATQPATSPVAKP